MRSSIGWWEQHICEIPLIFKRDDYGSDKFELICKFYRIGSARYIKYYWVDSTYSTIYHGELDSINLDTIDIHLIKDGDIEYPSSGCETDYDSYDDE